MSKELSSLIAGTMNWGVWGYNLAKRDMQERIFSYLNQGITTFDHADIYGGYTTEAAFGEAWQEMNIPRDNVKFISKCGIKYVGGSREYALKHYDCSKSYIIWSVEQSLKNLQTEYLDVLLLHRPSPLMQADEIGEAITKLKETGKIKDFGVSNFSVEQTALLQKNIPISYNQIQFSATHFEPMLNGSLDFMQIHSIQPMAWNPLGSIFKETNEQTQRLHDLFSKLELKYNCSKDLLMLTWIIKHPANILPVIGTTNINRITGLKDINSIVLSTEDWFAIWTESQGKKVP